MYMDSFLILWQSPLLFFMSKESLEILHLLKRPRQKASSAWGLMEGAKRGDRFYLYNTGTGHTALSTHNFKLSKYFDAVSSGQQSMCKV